MKLFTFLFFLFCCSSICQLRGQNKCLSSEHRHSFLTKNPDTDYNRNEMEAVLSEWMNSLESRERFRSVITIPIVVHVLYFASEENIPDEQIYSQIDILNEDYRSLNADINIVPAEYQSLIADTEIEFCLAAVDPDGNETNGITRKFVNNPIGLGGTTEIHYSDMGGQDAWDTEKYINIWVSKFAGGIGGISSFPGVGPATEDGVEINYLQFGSINVEPPYHLGRTLTHEIGHYLNLEHPWGPELNDCCDDDFITDTPESCETYIGQCPTHPVVSCSMPDLFMNFMFYADDACLTMFTQGQKMRMLATLNTLRSGLMDGGKCNFVSTNDLQGINGVKLFSNPVNDVLHFEILNDYFKNGQINIYDISGKVVFQEDIKQIGFYEILIADYKSGMYFLCLEKEGGIIVEKIIIN